jgi:hypothetical protein
VTIDAAYVRDKLADLAGNSDLSKYILPFGRFPAADSRPDRRPDRLDGGRGGSAAVRAFSGTMISIGDRRGQR